MELYLSIPLAVTIVAIIALPLLIGGSVALVGYHFAGFSGALQGFLEVYWRALVGVLILLAVCWAIYGGGVALVHLMS